MTRFLKEEFTGLGQFLKNYATETVIMFSAALFISLDHYHVIKNGDFSTFLFYAVFPILVILIVLRKTRSISGWVSVISVSGGSMFLSPA
jgi:hypothetical protein